MADSSLISKVLLSDIKSIIEYGKKQVYAAVNISMLNTYWNIGRRIVEEEQHGSTRFKDEFIKAQKNLTLQGNIVISVGLFGHSGGDEVWTEGTKDGQPVSVKQIWWAVKTFSSTLTYAEGRVFLTKEGSVLLAVLIRQERGALGRRHQPKALRGQG